MKKKYIGTSRKYQTLKNAILYAYELINNQDPDAAKTYYDDVKAKLDTYTQKGEALTALAIMEYSQSIT